MIFDLNKIVIFAGRFIIKKVSTYFHSINPGFDAEIAGKFLNGIYSTYCAPKV